MKKFTRLRIGKGEYIFKLEQLLQNKGISKNKLMRDTETDFKVIQRFCKGTTTKIDIYVLARFCDYLNCKPTDIIDYKNK